MLPERMRTATRTATFGYLGTVISYPAPEMCQGADEDLMVRIGEVVFPGRIQRWPTENGLRIWVDGHPNCPDSRNSAVAIFQTVLGVLRSWRADAGELHEEARGGVGAGSVRDEAGNQWVSVGTVMDYSVADREIENFAFQSRAGIEASGNLSNALWLNGRTGRSSADYYMIHEYAEFEFQDKKGIRDALGISVKSQEKLTWSANRLSPIAGGRHAQVSDHGALDLNGQKAFTARLLREWICLAAIDLSGQASRRPW